ncbi:MAG TPA: rod shape-determining protein, partial [Acidimicrobiales bacterium]|nr:rod shape-determining protein [Acidimicrobiales bacterium]
MTPDLVVDLGSANTRVADRSGAVLLEEPTLAAVDADSGRLLAFGREAYRLVAASAGRVSAVRPVRRSQLVDLELTDVLLGEVLRRAGASRLARPRVLAVVSSAATPVQLRALERSLRHAGARTVRFVEVALACAVGAGLPVDEPSGCMVVDVGAGTTEVGVLALGGVVASTVVPAAGDDLDDAVRQAIARRYDVHVDRRTLEAVRVALGSASLSLSPAPSVPPAAPPAAAAPPRAPSAPSAAAPAAASPASGAPAAASPAPAVDVPCRLRTSGEACTVRLRSEDVRPALDRVVRLILDAAVATITKAPPDLANDLLGSGVQLTGGVAHLHALDRRLATATGLPVHVDEPDLLAVRGASA